ncbi:MAG TPA: ABC transporter permease [Phototrophicaceae bacterium]|nr:ABC transporter permease [Phototrophicaceae bacterium]
MVQFVLRRLINAVPLLFFIAILVFFGLRLSGADPVAYLVTDPRISEADRFMLRARYGLNDPLWLQFVHWLVGDDWYERDVTGDGVPDEHGKRLGVLRGDFGESIRYRRPVTEVIGQFLPNTLILGLSAYAITLLFSMGIGVTAALRQYSLLDNVITTLSFVTYSMPIFFIALLCVQLFSVEFLKRGLPALPVQGMYDVRGDRSLGDLIRHLILPVFCLSAISIAGYSRYVRAMMLEVLHADYIRTARSKGLSERRITFVHALKNASLPVVTLIGIDLPLVLAGAVVTERIFSWPGMGLLFIQSLEPIDPSVIMVFVLLIALAVVISQIAVDIVYAWLDPRVRF